MDSSGEPGAEPPVAAARAVDIAGLAGHGAELRLDPTGRPVEPLLFVDLDGADWTKAPAAAAALDERRNTVIVGRSSAPLPQESESLIERFTLTLAPEGPGRMWVAAHDDDVALITSALTETPRAAMTCAWLLAATERSSVEDALIAESLAYSTLLAGSEFAAWRARTPRRVVPEAADSVSLERDAHALIVILNRPERRNAFSAAMRDGLLAGLEVAAHDDSIREIVVRGAGASFCSGGDLDEFGAATDPSTAHLVRLVHSAAYEVHRMRDRIRFVVHGASIGAGVEVPSFATRVEAHADAWFRLPEVSMGLIPGAGGTVGVPRRIGRWRTAYLALTGRSIAVDTALEWGLIDACV